MLWTEQRMSMSRLRGKIGLGFQGNRPVAEYSKIASVMEQYNFGWMHIYDDLVHRPAWPILFSLASSTKRMAIGPAVTHPFYRHPVVTAGNIACLDEATNGRAILGLGRGAYYECFGMQPKHQLAVLRETVKIVTHLLAGDKGAYIGNYFSINECGRLRFRPIRKQIPIFLGTWGPKTSQLAGELKQITGIKADSLWNPEYVRVLKNNIAIGASRSGRDPSEVSVEVGVMTYISNDLEEARSKLKWCLAADYLPFLADTRHDIDFDEEEIEKVKFFASKGQYDEGAKYVSDTSLELFTAYGKADRIIDQATRMFRAGVSRITFNHPHGSHVREAIEALGEKVLPHLQSTDDTEYEKRT